MKTIFTLITLFCAFFIPSSLCSQKGNYMLDKSFSKDGKLTTDVTENYYNNGSKLVTILAGKNGDIIAIGYSQKDFYKDVLFVKYRADGSLDSAFGSAGVMHYGGDNTDDVCNRAHLQSDGKILALIQSQDQPYLIRFFEDGSIDEKFGANGKVLLKYTGYSLDVDDCDNIVVAERPKRNQKLIFSLQRFNKNGKTDSTFGNQNLSSAHIGYEAYYDPIPQQVKFDKNGKIVVGGTWTPDGKSKMIFLRFTSHGAIDKSFNDSGKIVLDTLKEGATLYSMAITPDNKIIAGGAIGEASFIHDFDSQDFLVTRVLPTGTIDKKFGVNGFARTDFSSTLSPFRDDEIAAVCLQKDNKILAAGVTLAEVYDGLFATCRYLPDGELDTTYGDAGRIVTKFGDNNDTRINDAVLQPDEKLIVAGYHDSGGTFRMDVALARYLKEKPSSQKQNTSVTSMLNRVYISPNPATNILHIQGLPSNQKIKLTVVDFAGNVSIGQQLKANSNSSYNLNITSLRQGNYLLKIETKDNVITKQFVKE
jgi:uncharacterized delta-60 repeat protein